MTICVDKWNFMQNVAHIAPTIVYEVTRFRYVSTWERAHHIENNFTIYFLLKSTDKLIHKFYGFINYVINNVPCNPCRCNFDFQRVIFVLYVLLRRDIWSASGRKNVIWNVLSPNKMGFQFYHHCKRSVVRQACLGCKLKSNGNQITRRGKKRVIYRGQRCRSVTIHWNVPHEKWYFVAIDL